MTRSLLFPHRSTDLKELMEEADCDPRRLHNTYVQFRLINSLLAGWRGLYRRFLRPLAAGGSLDLLDIGFGGGDISLALARWARRDAMDLRITAIDTDPRALAYVRGRVNPARGRVNPAGVTFREVSTTDLVERGERFDVVISNHLLHHLEPAAVTELCRETSLLGRRAVIHSDIERGALAYGLFGLLTSPFFHRSYIVHDGLVSIRRSYTRGELQRLAPPAWWVERKIPFHQLLIYRKPIHEDRPDRSIPEVSGDS